jgi:hypothetical protein
LIAPVDRCEAQGRVNDHEATDFSVAMPEMVVG